MKELIKKLIPVSLMKAVRPLYHGALALLATQIYGNPSQKLFVIGVTGTAGKSTTVQLLAHILRSSGHKTGFTTTISYHNGEQEFLNRKNQSMPGGPILQKSMKEMLDKGCEYALIECTSEGLEQNRHLGISFDMALLTNLTPAHLDNHGSMEHYIAAKLRLFRAVMQSEKPKKIIGINLDSEHIAKFLELKNNGRENCTLFGVSFLGKTYGDVPVYAARTISEQPVAIALEDIEYTTKLSGMFNAYNALLSAAAALELGIDPAQGLNSFAGAPGRMEEIANDRGVKIFVDYACTVAAIKLALENVNKMPHNKIIHVFGMTGGLRDKSQRFAEGRISAELSDICILTNEDAYDSHVMDILNDIETGTTEAVHKKAQVIEKEPDRAKAIQRALDLASENDIVIITGKGSEQFHILEGNVKIEWDDREIVRNALKQ